MYESSSGGEGNESFSLTDAPFGFDHRTRWSSHGPATPRWNALPLDSAAGWGVAPTRFEQIAPPSIATHCFEAQLPSAGVEPFFSGAPARRGLLRWDRLWVLRMSS